MNKKTIGLIFLSCLLTAISVGQDRLYLQNGSKLKGKYVVSLSTDTTIYFDMGTNGVHIPYNLLSYARFSRESKKLGVKKDFVKKHDLPIKTGYYSRVGISSLLGTHDPYGYVLEDPTFSLRATNGYRWSRALNIGAKLAIDSYGEFTSVPIATHYEYAFRKRKLSPVVMAGVGYGFVWRKATDNNTFDTIHGGLHYYFDWGYKFSMNESDIIIKIGWQRQTLVQKIDEPNLPEYYWGVSKQKRILRRVTVGLAYTF